MTQAPRTVCVLGFSRSGTSLTTRVLNLLGVDVGPTEELLQPVEGDNPRGYWEPRWLIDLNDEILAELGTTWWRSLPAAPGWQHAPALAPLRARARERFEQSLAARPLHALKDPRLSLTLPLWREVLAEVSYVICLRNPADSIASIRQRSEPTLSVQEWGDVWLEHVGRSLQETAGSRRVLIFYEDYFGPQRDAQLMRLAALLDGAVAAERIRQAQATIEDGLRHHASAPPPLADPSELGAPTRSAFLALRAAQDLRDAADGSAVLADAIERSVVELWRAHAGSPQTASSAVRLTGVAPLGA